MNIASNSTNWVVITGAPSSGKTSVIECLRTRGFEIMEEAARSVIEEKLSSGEIIDGKTLVTDIFNRQVRDLKLKDTQALMFLDRALGDNIAYHQFHGMDDSVCVAASALYRYRAVIILDRLPFLADGVRLENDEEAAELDRLLDKSYTALGYTAHRIPVISIEERADLILKLINEPLPSPGLSPMLQPAP